MFREIRRNKKQVLSKERCVDIIEKSTSGVMSVYGDDDYPYGVPLNYVFDGTKLYFHSMPVGHKMDSIKKHDKVCFTIIETDNIIPEEYTSYFRSVILFGKAHIIEDLAEKRKVLEMLVDKYSKDFKKEGESVVEKNVTVAAIVCIEIDHMSGKEAIELAESSESK